MVSKSKKQKPGKSYSFFDANNVLYCHGCIEKDVDDEDLGSSLKVVKFDQDIDEDFFLLVVMFHFLLTSSAKMILMMKTDTRQSLQMNVALWLLLRLAYILLQR